MEDFMFGLIGKILGVSWRDDEEEMRVCVHCGGNFTGDHGHRNCPMNPRTEQKTVVTQRG